MFESKKENRRTLDRVGEFKTRIGEEAVFEGTLRGSGHHRVAGTVIGGCDLTGVLWIEVEGRWRGEIRADVVVISGTIDGDVFAHTKIELLETGRVTGNLEAPAIAIAEGGRFDGKVKMARSENVTRFKEQRESAYTEPDSF